MMTTLYLAAAVAGGTVLVCQFVLALIGLGHDGADFSHDGGGDFNGDAHLGDSTVGDHGGIDAAGQDGHAGETHPDSTHLFAVVSFRTLVAALAFFGVTGLSTHSAGFPAAGSLLLALVAGIGAMYGMYGLLRLIAGLSSAGNERITNAMGVTGKVYIPIPASGQGTGKVQLTVQNRVVEYLAVTSDSTTLKTGESVEVVSVRSSDTVEVRRVVSAAAQPAAS